MSACKIVLRCTCLYNLLVKISACSHRLNVAHPARPFLMIARILSLVNVRSGGCWAPVLPSIWLAILGAGHESGQNLKIKDLRSQEAAGLLPSAASGLPSREPGLTLGLGRRGGLSACLGDACGEPKSPGYLM